MKVTTGDKRRTRRNPPPKTRVKPAGQGRKQNRTGRSGEVALSREARSTPGEDSRRVSRISQGLAEAYAANPHKSKESVRVGTYNVGAGNKEASRRSNFEKTRDLIARELVDGGVDVMALQEVGVNGRKTRGRDNNQEILEAVFTRELGDGWKNADLNRVSLDERGQPVVQDNKPVYDPEKYADTRVTATNAEGQTRDMDVRRQRSDADGKPLKWEDGPGKGPVVTYQAEVAPGKEYSIVYGSSNESGSYGNGVLLGPDYEVSASQRRVLGHDSPEKNDKGNPEARTALGVTFTTPEGEELSLISAHLTNGKAEDRGKARDQQYAALDDFAESLESEGQPVIIGGDFNSKAGGEYGKRFYHGLPWVDPPRHPSNQDLGWDDPDRDSDKIDRLYTLGEVDIGGREIHQDQGGSDHDLITWDAGL